MADPRLSIIIPTLNRGKLFHDTVRHCLEQRESSWEMWLVDQSDEEQEAANRAMVDELSDSRVHYLHLTERGVPNARNEGLARCNGEIVLFLDDDVILLADDFFDAHLDSYEDDEVGGVTGRIVERTVRPNTKHTANHISWGGRIITNLYGTEPCQIRSLKGANMSYRAKAIEQLGGFDRQD
ncbi:MAG: glycosyltransferase family 2 protein, partial [Myxococcota bacterium]|nr:glycosyltransferase family 2 protein [Myxococcota bacterium]